MGLRSDQDTSWKDAINAWFRAFLAFFFPRTEALLDWSRDCEPLAAELRKLTANAAVGKRLADKVVKASNLDGDARYLHAEVQGTPEDAFPGRVYVSNYRCRDRFNQPVGSVVILADDDPKWRPTEHVEWTEESSTVFRFSARKLLDWVGKEAELDADPNPFALLVRAHPGWRATEKDAAGREGAKVAVGPATLLAFPGPSRGGIPLRLLYVMLPLSEADEREVWNRVVQFEEERKMPFISVGERIGIEKGLERGLEKGLEKGQVKVLRSLPRARFGTEGESLLAAPDPPRRRGVARQTRGGNPRGGRPRNGPECARAAVLTERAHSQCVAGTFSETTDGTIKRIRPGRTAALSAADRRSYPDRQEFRDLRGGPVARWRPRGEGPIGIRGDSVAAPRSL